MQKEFWKVFPEYLELNYSGLKENCIVYFLIWSEFLLYMV